MTNALDLVASLRLESGRRWDEVALPWQWADMRALLGAGPLDPIRRHFWLRARGMAKTGDGAAGALSLLVTEAPERSRSYAYASDSDQAALVGDSIVGYVERTGLSDLVDITGRTITCRATGATLSVESSDSASAFGLRPWLLVVDEVAQWPDTRGHAKLWGAIISSVGKVSDARFARDVLRRQPVTSRLQALAGRRVLRALARQPQHRSLPVVVRRRRWRRCRATDRKRERPVHPVRMGRG